MKLWEPAHAMVDATSSAGRIVAESGNYVMGKRVEEFERAWAKKTEAEVVVGVSSCSDALYITLRYLRDVHELRTVHVPTFTFIATVEPAIRLGLNVVLHDVDLATACMESYMAEEVEGDGVWLPVQLYGYPVTLPNSETLVTGIDAAQGHGIPIPWDYVEAACYSFYPTKNLGAAGQAGAIAGSAELAQYARQARAHGEGDTRFVHEFFSGNYRMDEIQGEILARQLEAGFHGAQVIRQAVGMVYRELLELYGIDDVIIPQEAHESHVYHLLGVRVKVKGKGKGRDELKDYLASKGIQTAVRYPVPIHKQPAAKELVAGQKKKFPGADQWAAEGLTLPMHAKMDDNQVELVIREIARWVRSK